jgi:GTP-binding protein Era
MDRCGVVAMMGLVNAGKSTLANALAGRHMRLVSHKAGSTKAMGAIHVVQAGYRCALLDTPGLVRGLQPGSRVPRAVRQAADQAHGLLWVAAAPSFGLADLDWIKYFLTLGKPMAVVLSKVDRMRPRSLLLPLLAELGSLSGLAFIMPVATLRQENIPELAMALPPLLPTLTELPHWAEEPAWQEIACELFREQVFEHVHQELPHRITVTLETSRETAAGLQLGFVVWVERPAQQGIVIGRGGERLKAMASAARLQLSAVLGQPVHVQVWVRARREVREV